MEKKSLILAFLIWAFLGWIGAHRAYIKSSFVVLFYYWIFSLLTFGVIIVIDLFLLKGMIDKEYYKMHYDEQKEKEKLTEYTKEYFDSKKPEIKEYNKIGF